MGNALIKRERADASNYELWLRENARVETPKNFRSGSFNRKSRTAGVLLACAAGLGVGSGIGHLAYEKEVSNGKRLLQTRRRK